MCYTHAYTYTYIFMSTSGALETLPSEEVLAAELAVLLDCRATKLCQTQFRNRPPKATRKTRTCPPIRTPPLGISA